MTHYETFVSKSQFEQALIPLLRVPFNLNVTEDPEKYNNEYENNPGWLILIPLEGTAQIKFLRKRYGPEELEIPSLSPLVCPPNSQLKWIKYPIKSLKFNLKNGKLAITLKGPNASAHFDAECHEASAISQRILDLLENCLHEFSQSDELRKLKAEQFLKVAMIDMVDYQCKEIYHGVRLPAKRKVFISFLQFLERHFSSFLNSSQLAEKYSKSPQYLSKVTQNMRGMSLSKFTQFYRLERARNFLKLHMVNQASKKSGFKECSHFIQLFKKQFGMTPKQAQTYLELPLEREDAIRFHATTGLQIIENSSHQQILTKTAEYNRTLLVANHSCERVDLKWFPENGVNVAIRSIPPYSRVHLSATPGDNLGVCGSHKSDLFVMNKGNSIYVYTVSH